MNFLTSLIEMGVILEFLTFYEGASYSYVLSTFFEDVHHHAALPDKTAKQNRSRRALYLMLSNNCCNCAIYIVNILNYF
jgi:hypothetical protein